jgi:hypothetical protein
MSVFHVIQWSVEPPDQDACEQAVKVLAEHVESVHPTARSFRTYRQSFGPLPLWTYFGLVEFENMTAWDDDPSAPSCEEAWAPIYAIAQPGSFAMSLWADSQRETWFER